MGLETQQGLGSFLFTTIRSHIFITEQCSVWATVTIH